MRRTLPILLLILCLALAAGCQKQDPPTDPNPPADNGQPPDDSGSDDGNGSDSGTTTPVTTPPAGGIQLGHPEIDPDEVKAMQDRVDAGEDLWLLDPLEVAKREGPKFGFSADDTFNLIQQIEVGEGSGTGEAVVQVVHRGDLYFIQLIQPNGPGEDSIWWINAVMRDAK